MARNRLTQEDMIMARKQFERVTCPKCARTYAILKGSTKAFHCPGSNCHEMVNASAAPTGNGADASATPPVKRESK